MNRDREHASHIDIFRRGVEAVGALAEITEKKGTRSVSVATGAVILLLLIGEFGTARDYVPHQGEIVGLIIGAILILAGVVLGSIEYKWHVDAQVREREIINEQLRLETDYNIARLKETRLEGAAKTEESRIPKPRP